MVKVHCCRNIMLKAKYAQKIKNSTIKFLKNFVYVQPVYNLSTVEKKKINTCRFRYGVFLNANFENNLC